MLGTEDHPSLGAKAAESHGLLEFVHWLFGNHLERFDNLTFEKKRKGKFLLEAAKAAMGLDDVFQAEHRKMTRSQVQTAFNSYVRFLSFYAKAGGNITPKCHFMLHLIQRSLFKGNPRLYTTYRDESFNGLLAKIARSCHRRTWMNAIHWKCRELHSKHHQKVIKSKLFDKKIGEKTHAKPAVLVHQLGGEKLFENHHCNTHILVLLHFLLQAHSCAKWARLQLHGNAAWLPDHTFER